MSAAPCGDAPAEPDFAEDEQCGEQPLDPIVAPQGTAIGEVASKPRLVVIWIGLITTGGGDGMGEGVGNTPVYGPPGVGSGDGTGLGVGV